MISEYKEVADRFYESEVRCEKLIPIYMCLADTPSDDLLDAIWEETDVCELLEIHPEIENRDEIAETLRGNGKIGYLAQFATPTPTRFSKSGDGCSFSWGYYMTKWFYSDDIEALELQAVQWAKEYFEECKAQEMACG